MPKTAEHRACITCGIQLRHQQIREGVTIWRNSINFILCVNSMSIVGPCRLRKQLDHYPYRLYQHALIILGVQYVTLQPERHYEKYVYSYFIRVPAWHLHGEAKFDPQGLRLIFLYCKNGLYLKTCNWVWLKQTNHLYKYSTKYGRAGKSGISSLFAQSKGLNTKVRLDTRPLSSHGYLWKLPPRGFKNQS